MKYIIRQLTCPMEVIAAQRLLHNDYRYNQKWEPRPDNPSNVRYLNGRLRDAFEDKAVWFGAYYKGEIVGCIRIITVDMEVGRYIPMPYDETAGEINRLCIAKEHRGTSVMMLLSVHAFIWGLRNGRKTAYTTFPPKLARYYEKLGWESVLVFKYHQTDPEERVLLSLSIGYWSFAKYAVKSIIVTVKRWFK